MEEENKEPVKTADTPILSWETFEYEFKEKSQDWFWILGVLAIGGAFLSLLFKNFLLTIIILLGAFAMSSHAKRPPEMVLVSLNRKGIKVKNVFYPHETIESFWVETDTDTPKLMLKSDRFFMPHFHLPIVGIEPEKVRGFLLDYIPEEKHEDNFIYQIAEKIGF